MNESTIITIFFIIYAVSWIAFLVAVWVWSELREIKSDGKTIRYLLQENQTIKERLDGIEKAMMKSGYRPPHKR